MIKRTLTLIVAVLISPRTCPGTATAAKRPNVLFIFTDDQRPDAFGALGNPDIKTPNMDRIINSGFVFNRAYIQGSMTFATCLPSRAMIMSGKPLFRAPLQLDSGVLMPQVFQKSGYRTFATGKWHNGESSFEKCFDEAEAVFFGGAARTHINVPVNRMIAGLMVPYDAGETFSTDLFADAAIEFIEGQSEKEQPFFCYIPTAIPHAAMHAPKALHEKWRKVFPQFDKKIGKYGAGGEPCPDVVNPIAGFAAMMEHLDNEIGALLKLLDELGVDNNTLVMFSSDNGAHAILMVGVGGESGAHERMSVE